MLLIRGCELEATNRKLLTRSYLAEATCLIHRRRSWSARTRSVSTLRTRSGHRAHGRARGETAGLRTQKPRPKRACRRPGRRQVVAAPQRRQKAMRTVQGVLRKTRRPRRPRRLRRPQHGRRSRGRGLARSQVRMRRVQTTLLRNRCDRAPPQPHSPRAGRLTRRILRLILRLIHRLILRLIRRILWPIITIRSPSAGEVHRGYQRV